MPRNNAPALAAAALVALALPVRARVICYKTTALMWDASANAPAPVTTEVLDRVHAAFRLWEEAADGAIRFVYSGVSGPSFDGVAQLPEDGCVHAVLHGERNFHGELAHGRFTGDIPDEYRRGYFFVSRAPSALSLSTLAHEIGHALGLPHAADARSIMFSGPRSADSAALSAQDGADVRLRWAGVSGRVYSISGTIATGRAHPIAAIFAERPDGGSYSARSDPNGGFTVAVPEPGNYRLVARPVTVARDLTEEALGGIGESWYVSDGVSSPEPGRAAVLRLSAGAPSLSGLTLRTLDLPRPASNPEPARSFPDPVLPPPGLAARRQPVLRFSFDRGFDDEGSLGLRARTNGDEVSLVPGARGSALFVGGTEDWLDVALSTAVSLERGFTLELWFRRDDWTNPYRGGSGWQTLASVTTDASLAITAPGCPLHKPWALHGYVSRERESSNVFSRPGLPPGKWTHAAFVYDADERSVTLYLDGERADKAKGVPVPKFAHRNLRLGTWHKANQAFRGAIDEVDVYDYARGPSEISVAAGTR